MLSLLALLFTLPQAHAAPVDHLQCEFKYVEASTPGYTFSGELTSERIKAEPPAGAAYSLSHGEVSQTAKVVSADHIVSLAYRLDYEHATLNHQARQSSCLAILAEVCSTETPPKCLMQSQSCAVSQDPFNVNYGWPVVPLISDVPGFNAAGLRPAHFTLKDLQNRIVGEATANCVYLGTNP